MIFQVLELPRKKYMPVARSVIKILVSFVSLLNSGVTGISRPAISLIKKLDVADEFVIVTKLKLLTGLGYNKVIKSSGGPTGPVSPSK